MKTLLMTFFPNTQSSLTLAKLDFVWTAVKKEIVVQIENTGDRDTGPFVIKFDIEKTFGISQSHVRYVEDLKSGDSVNVMVDFGVFNQTKIDYLRDVEKLMIYVEGVSEEEVIAISADSKKFSCLSH